MDVLRFRPVGRTWYRSHVLIRKFASDNTDCGYGYVVEKTSHRWAGLMEQASVASFASAPGGAGICTKEIRAFAFLVDGQQSRIGFAVSDMLSRFDSHPAAYLARKLPYDIPLTLFMNTKLIREEETTSRSG